MHILKTTSGLVLLIAATVLMVAQTTARGQCQTARVIPHDELDYGNGFSERSVAIDGDYAVISAEDDREVLRDGGAVYVFRREGLNWVEDAKLIASDVESDADFGRAIAISGDRILVGAPENDELGENFGAAYVFRREGQFWVEEAKLLPSGPDVVERYRFGLSVVLSGDRALVGTGKVNAFVFRREGTVWVEEAILRSSDFGQWVGFSGDYAVMPDDTNREDGSEMAALLVFRREGTSWLPHSLLTTSEPEMGSDFWSGAMSGDLIVAGEIHGYSGAGFAVVFRKEGNDWIEEATLRASDGETGDQFGTAVAIEGDMVLVGATGSTDGDRPGTVYIFQHDGADWIETGKLTASDPGASDRFGVTVAVSGGTALVGRHEGPHFSWEHPKAAYFFEVAGDCNANGSPDGCDILNGLSEDCDGNAVPDECETSPDCNYNGIRDDCEIAEGIVADCNHNDVPDDCDIILGTSPDDDDNGIPDECGEPPAFGRCEMHTFTPEGPLGDRFGWDVAIDGDRMVIGSYGDDPDDDNPRNSDQGAIYIYQHDGAQWVLETRIERPDDDDDRDQFGRTVAIDGEWIAAASHNEAWVFRREGDTWGEGTKLPVADPWGNGFGFGWEGIAIDGDRMIVGSPFDDSAFNGAGAAHLYRLEDFAWVEEVKLTPEVDVDAEWFGWDVALNGDLAMIGAPSDDDLGHNSGSVYVYRATGPEGSWTLDTKLHAPDGGSSDGFGYSVATDGDLLAVGAPFATNVVASDGTVYVFRREGSEWVFEARLTAPDPELTDFFGFDLSLSGDRLLVGTNPEFLTLTGKAYVFRRFGTTWVEEARLTISDGVVGDHGITGVGISGNRLAIGAPNRGNVDADIGVTNAFELEGDTWVETQALTPGLAVEGAQFGASVAISGDLAVVGAVAEDTDRGPPNGVAYVYQRVDTTWTLLNRHTLGSDREYAYSVDVEGDEIIIGYPGGDTVDVFVRVNGEIDGQPTTSLEHPDRTDNSYDRFGHAVSISGNYLLVAANEDDDWGLDSGSAYVFRRNGDGWIEAAQLSASDAQADDHFGESVSMSGLMAAVGAIQDRPGGGGAVYLYFNPNTPRSETLKLTASDNAEGDRFGASVALDGGLLVVGATQVTNDGTGAVYVFRKLDPVTWVEEAKLVASDAAPGDRFGCSVAVRDGLIVVGASGNDDAGTDSGASYVFRHDGTGWFEVMKTVPSNARPGDQFGVSVAIDGDYAMVGASFVDFEAIDSGSAYLFAVDGPDLNIDGVPDVCDPDCNDNGVDDEIDILEGTSEDCTGNGMPDECEPDCNDNGAADSCDLSALGFSLDCNLDSVPDECQLVDNDCNTNAIPDDCEVDVNKDGLPDDCCTNNAFCHDGDPCNFDRCMSNTCQYTPAEYGDVAGAGSTCGPDGQVNLFDILAVLDGFQGVFAVGCEVSNIDIASQSDACVPDGVISLTDILAVLDAFQGATACCQ